ncbi:MAG: FliH/SctL family protein, partial [Gammaproteobacteria bacterium]|nr:FliH/SctL family protein [Gammaproteobacteria bacterium]
MALNHSYAKKNRSPQAWNLPNVNGVVIEDFEQGEPAVPAPRKTPTGEEQEVTLEPCHDRRVLPSVEQIASIERQAHEEGYKKGHAEGLAQAKASAQEKIVAFERLLHKMNAPFDELAEQAEEELLLLVLTLAKQLVRREIKTAPGEVIAVLRESIALLPSSSAEIRIHLHPDDALLVRELLSVSEEGNQNWHLYEDPMLTRG